MQFPLFSSLVLVVLSGCAWRAPLLPKVALERPPPIGLAHTAPSDPSRALVAAAPDAAQADSGGPSAPVASEERASDADDGAEDDQDVDDEGVEEEGESIEDANVAPSEELRYTADLDDETLREKFATDPESLGSISIGFAHDGRLMNGVRLPDSGPGWVVLCPEGAWATRETLDYVEAAAGSVHGQFPEAPPLRVTQLSVREGGYVRPHRSHQNGRDVDLGFYYPGGQQIIARAREKVIDVALNWALVKALVTLTDLQMILVDRRVQKVLYEHALAAGEDRAWLDSLFHAGKDSILQHARRHRDHFHVRFVNARAQELGRRVMPLLPERPEYRMRTHRVRAGDTLSHIAARYRSSVTAIKKANGLRGSLLRLAQVLHVPIRGPCTRCPVPPPVILRPRRLPPEHVESDVPRAESVASPDRTAAR